MATQTIERPVVRAAVDLDALFAAIRMFWSPRVASTASCAAIRSQRALRC